MVKFGSTPILSKVLIIENLVGMKIFYGKLVTNIEPWVVNKCNLVNKYINYSFLFIILFTKFNTSFRKTHFVFDQWFILSMKATCPFLILPFIYDFICNFIGKLGFSVIATTSVNPKQLCALGWYIIGQKTSSSQWVSKAS